MLTSVIVSCHVCRPSALRVHAAKTERLLPRAPHAGACTLLCDCSRHSLHMFAEGVSAFDTFFWPWSSLPCDHQHCSALCTPGPQHTLVMSVRCVLESAATAQLIQSRRMAQSVTGKWVEGWQAAFILCSVGRVISGVAMVRNRCSQFVSALCS